MFGEMFVSKYSNLNPIHPALKAKTFLIKKVVFV